MIVISEDATPPKWTRKPQARPEEVLEAALDLFARNGFAATRMQDIAKAAGLSKAAIYLYFPSKEDVFKALVETRLVVLRAEMTKHGALTRGDPVAALRRIVQLWVASNADPRIVALPRIVLAESSRFPELADHYHRVVITQTQSILVDLIETGIATGAFRSIDSKIAARALVAPLLFEMLRQQAFKGHRDELPLPQLSETFFDLFLGGISAQSKPAHQGETL
jgi:AcrR family transcriptional regulator